MNKISDTFTKEQTIKISGNVFKFRKFGIGAALDLEDKYGSIDDGIKALTDNPKMRIIAEFMYLMLHKETKEQFDNYDDFIENVGIVDFTQLVEPLLKIVSSGMPEEQKTKEKKKKLIKK